jgi:Ion channel
MLSKLVIGWSLMALCVTIHATGVALLMGGVRRRVASRQRFWSWSWLFVRLAGWIIVLHLIEITLWAVFYVWTSAMPDLPTGLYFSAVTYTTTGYGDLVLPREWQLLSGIEALTGILMCGWSTGFFFAVFTRMFQAETRPVDTP